MASCYFPLEYLGEFLSQSMTSREIAYTSVSVMFDSIPAWGSCHKRIGSQVILSSPSDQNPSQDCFKCINIVLRSPNVLQVHTNNLDKCHANEEAALASCPSRQEIRERKATEMMLYKTRGFYGGSSITRTYCPLNGRYKFTYSINDGTEDDLECQEPVSEAGDCPSRYKFDLHFRGCSFPNFGKINKKFNLFHHDIKWTEIYFRHELPMFSLLAWRKWWDLYESARHKTTPTWWRGQTTLQMCSKFYSFTPSLNVIVCVSVLWQSWRVWTFSVRWWFHILNNTMKVLRQRWDIIRWKFSMNHWPQHSWHKNQPRNL